MVQPGCSLTAIKTWERGEAQELISLIWYVISRVFIIGLEFNLLLQSSKILSHWLLQSQQLYHDRFRGSGAGNSAAHHRDASTAANGASSRCNLSGEVSTSSASIKGKERVKSETCQSSPPENLGDSISSSIPGKENGKEEEESKTSQTLKSS